MSSEDVAGAEGNIDTRWLPEMYDVIAPDGSEICLLATVSRGSMVHCRLPAGAVSRPIAHRTVEELWYVLAGQGQMWRCHDGQESVIELGPGCSLNTPLGASFQFRNTGESPLEIVIVTMPPWPGEDEAIPRAGHWSVPE